MNNKAIILLIAAVAVIIGSAIVVNCCDTRNVDADPTTEHSLTLVVNGCDSSAVQLKIAPNQLGSPIETSGSTTASLGMTTSKGTLIENGQCQTGKTIGIWNTITSFRDFDLTSISIKCGGQDVNWCHDSWKYYFIMPDGDTIVTINYNTVQVKVTPSEHATVTSLTVSNSSRVGNYFIPGETIAVNHNFTGEYQLKELTVDSSIATANGKNITIKTGITEPKEMTVQMIEEEKQYQIIVGGTGNAGAFEGGTASASKTIAKAGETINLTVTSNAGFVVESISDSFNHVLGLTKDSRSFEMPAYNVSIVVGFVKADYTITIADVTGGSVTASQYTANYGDEIILTVTPEKRYFLRSLSSDDVTLTSDTRTFAMPDKNITITPVFEQMAQLSCTSVTSSGKVILDVTVAASIGTGMADPMFLIAGTYDGDIVINAYSHIKVGMDHTERIALSSDGLQEIFVQLVDGISSDPTGYYCVYSVNPGA